MKSGAQNCPRCGTVLAGSVTGGLCPRCMGVFLLESTPDDASAGDDAPSGIRFGDFELGEELGRGAMGVVYRARQTGLNRDVALKVVLAGQFAGDSDRKRFMAEAEAAARLDHPNIVPIYAVGEHDERQYYAMRLIEGRSLATMLKPPWEPARAARFVARLARAVHHAHQRGVLHRDLKPANVLVDGAGEPHITDFGLARRLDSDGGLTVTGSPLGTPAYMAPEQAASDGAATTAADVYGLGAILYELLAGHPPFSADNLPAMLRKITEEAPVPLSAGLPRDLTTVVGKCLRKEPSRRYASAEELAADLDAWVDGRPVQARPVTNLERLRLWCRRRPAVAGLSAAVLVLLLTVAVGGPVIALRLASARREERAANAESRGRLYDALLAQARASRLTLEPGRRAAGLAAIRSAAEIRVTAELRDEALAYLALVDHSVPTNATRNIFWGEHVSRSPNFILEARNTKDVAVSVSNTVTGKELFQWRPPDTNAFPKAGRFSPDSSRLAVQLDGRGFYIVDAVSGGTVGWWSNAWFVAFDPSGRHFAAVHRGRELIVHDSATGAAAVRRDFGEGLRSECAFHPGPDVALLAVSSMQTLWIWDWRRDRILETRGFDSELWAVDWGGDFLATSHRDGTIRMRDFRRHEDMLLNGHRSPVSDIFFSPDGRWFVSAGYDSSAVFWDSHTGTALVRDQDLYPVQFSADGRQINLANFGASAVVGVDMPAGFRSFVCSRDSSVTFSPDGRLIFAAGRRFEVLNAETGERLWDGPEGRFNDVEALPDGRGFLRTAYEEVVRGRFENDGGRLRLAGMETVLKGGTEDLQGGCLTPDGSTYLIADSANRVMAVPLADPEARTVFTGAIIPRGPALSADGRWIAAGTFHGSGVHVWSITNRTTPKRLQTGNATVCFNPDGSRLCVAANDRVTVYESGSWTRLFTAPTDSGSSLPGRAAWSPDGKVLAYSRRGRELHLVETTDWKAVGRLTSPTPASIDAVVFAPGGRRVMTVSDSGRLELWDFEELRSGLAALGIRWELPMSGVRVPAGPPEFDKLLPLPLQAALPPGYRVASEFGLRSAEATARQLDLSAHYLARLDEDWHHTGEPANSLAKLQPGLQEMAGVRFDIRGIVQLSASRIGPANPYPKTVKGIEVRQKCRRLRFLGGAGWATDASLHGLRAASYIVRYADGSTAEVPVRVGHETRDWWDAGDPSLDNAVRAWRGDGKSLWMHTWENPKPEIEVVSLDFVSAMKEPAPFVVAITAE